MSDSHQRASSDGGDELPPSVSRRSLLGGVIAGIIGIGAGTSSAEAAVPGLHVEIDGEIDPGTQLVLRVRDDRGRHQQFAVEGSSGLPASTTLDRVRTEGEAEFDLLVYGDGTVTVDKLEFDPRGGPYSEGSTGPGPIYSIASNLYSIAYSAVMYGAIATGLFGMLLYTKGTVSSSSNSRSDGLRWARGAVIVLLILFGLGTLYALLGGLIP